MELDHEPVRVAGLSQGELSELVGLSRLSVNRYMQSNTGPKRENDRKHYEKVLKLIAAAVKLGILPHQLPPRKRGVSRQHDIEQALEATKQKIAALRAKRS